MYLKILLKDLRRKKTMNVIILLFVILSAMFAASSANNIVSIIGGIDSYFDKAGLTDYFVLDQGRSDVEAVLKGQPEVTDYKVEHGCFGIEDNFLISGERMYRFANATIIMSVDDAKINYFDSSDDIIREVPQGSAYISASLGNSSGIKKGDTFTLKIGEKSLDLVFAGIAKDALLGAPMVDNARCILNEKDFLFLTQDNDAATPMNVYYINTNDKKALSSVISEIPEVIVCGDRELIRTANFMNILVSAMLLILSLCLVLISFVVLRFTIGFTIAEEFREIGVMKAIGMKNAPIRLLYVVKYLGIAIAGAALGFIASIPFGNMLMSSVRDQMVLRNGHSLLIGILSAAAVVLLIALFAWSSTGRIRKLSPVDAVRSGQTGERFRKKSVMSLGRSRLGTTGFLSANDVLSSPRQSAMIAGIFTICILLVMILVNGCNTASSDRMLPLLGNKKSDIYTHSVGLTHDEVTGKLSVTDVINEAEKKLAENGIPGKVRFERMNSFPVTHGKNRLMATFQWSKETDAADYEYGEGTPPAYPNEIAMSYKMADILDMRIGDRAMITIDGEDREFILTALYQTFNKMGECGRFHQDADIPDSGVPNLFDMQIDFDDHPAGAELDKRIRLCNEIFDTDDSTDSIGFVERCMGVSDLLNGLKIMTLIIAAAIALMISILMERSFIAKNKNEIALQKALGFKSRAIIVQHTLRFVILCTFSAVLAGLLCYPLTKLAMDPAMAMAGADKGVAYVIRPVDVFLIYPGIILAVTFAGAFLTSLVSYSVKAYSTSDIE